MSQLLESPSLSAYALASSEPSPVARMMGAFAEDFRQNVDINLGVGYVNEETIPGEKIKKALTEVLSNSVKYKAAFNYGGPSGSQNLINSIRSFYLSQGIGGLSQELLNQKRMIIGASGATSLLEAVAEVLQPGIVLTSDPMYYIYCDYLQRKGFEIIAICEDEQGISTEHLEQKINSLGARKKDISFLYVITVNNPTSSILSNQRRQQLVEIASRLSQELTRQIPLLVDKAYEELVHDPEVPKLLSAMLWDELGIVYEIGTVSKILAPALRVGYMIGNNGPLLKAIVQKTSDTGFSASLINQEIASYFIDNFVALQLENVNAGYRKKAMAVKRAIDEHLGEYLTNCVGGKAGFYFYLTFKAIETTESSVFFRFLTRTTGKEDVDKESGGKAPRVIYIPGEFCVHPRGDLRETGKCQLRISYGFEETERIVEAIKFMGEAAKYSMHRST